MTKISAKKLTENQMGLLIGQLWKAVTLLENKEEVHKFLRDLLTRTESQMLAKRLQAVKMLKEGCKYFEIRKKLNMSDVTIAKLRNEYESFGEGYRMVIERLHRIEEKHLPKKRSIIPKRKTAGQALIQYATHEAVGAYKRYSKRKSAEK